MAEAPRLVAQDEATRSRKRLSLNLPVCLVIQRPDRVQLVDARFRDMSEDGTAIFAGVEIAIDSEIQIEFTPPFHRGPLRVRAVVRNRRKYTYGVEFLPCSHEQAQNLDVLKAMLLSAGTATSGSIDDRRWEY